MRLFLWSYLLFIVVKPQLAIASRNITDPAFIDDAISELGSNKPQNSVVFIDNLLKPYPRFDPEPLSPTIKGVAHEYLEIILDCFPAMVDELPTMAEDNILFNLPVVAAKVNRYDRANFQQPIKLWMYPHLHVPYVDLRDKGKDMTTAKSRPEHTSWYMELTANDIFPGTVRGIVTASTPLILESFRDQIPVLKRRFTESNMKFALMIDSLAACENFPGQIDDFKELLYNFDAFFFHLPRQLSENDRTGDELEDAILERKVLQVVYTKCHELLEPFLPSGAVLTPVRGYLRAKYDEVEHKGFKFSFDIIRF